MTHHPVTPTRETEGAPVSPLGVGEKATFGKVLRDQRKVILVAAALVVADFWILIQLFLGANDPYSALKTTLRAEIDPEAWATLNSDTSRPFEKPRRVALP